MKPIALFIMLTVYTVVISITAYLFRRVLTTPPKPEPDSYSENDDILIREPD